MVSHIQTRCNVLKFWSKLMSVEQGLGRKWFEGMLEKKFLKKEAAFGLKVEADGKMVWSGV